MIFSSHRLTLLIISAALIFAVLVAVEVSAHSGAEQEALAVGAAPVGGNAQRELPLRGLTCLHGVAWAGKKAGSINFSVACAPKDGRDHVVFSLSTYAVEKGKGSPRIVGFRRKPPLLGGGSGRQFGSCQLHSRVLDCAALAQGPVRVRGRIWMKPQERCRTGITIFVVRPANCETEGCHPVLVVKRLYRAIARGC